MHHRLQPTPPDPQNTTFSPFPAQIPTVTPHVIYVPLGDGSLGQQHLQQLVPEELFQSMGIVIRGDMEVPLLVKGAIGYDDVAVRVEAEEVAEGLYGAGTAGHCVFTLCDLS